MNTWSPTLTNSGVPRLPSYGGGIPPSGQINASNLAYVRGGIATDPTADVTADLLNPNWGPAVYDTERRGAELAAGGGYSGSPLAAYQTSRMRAADIERRAALASSLLSGASQRLPNPASQENLLAQQQQGQEFAQQQALREQEFAWQKQQKMQDDLYKSGYRYGGGRSGGYNPLPQYMNAGGSGSSYTEIPWGPGQSGPSGPPSTYRY